MNRILLHKSSRIIACAWLLIGISRLSSAGSVPVFEQVGTLAGPSSSESTPFTITASGTYLARITDLTFFPGSAFDTVALGISTSTQLLGYTFLINPSTNDSTSFTFSATPGKYFSNVLATCSGLCTYGVNITTIPIPPAITLFSIGLVGLVLIGRRIRGRR